MGLGDPGLPAPPRVATIAPTSLQEFHDLCRALAVKETLPHSVMLAYQDDLGAGQQPDIFKRFYWWEDECVADLQSAFGVTVERRSFRALAERAAATGRARRRTHRRSVPMVSLG